MAYLIKLGLHIPLSQQAYPERPHEAHDMQSPASRDAVSPRQKPPKLPPLAYPDRFEGRDVSATGGIRWQHQWGNGSHPCIGADVGLEDIDEGLWNVSCGPLTRGRLLERHLRIEVASGRLTRHRGR